MTDRNPLTGLPGNHSIMRALQRDVLQGDRTAVYVDIVNFKPFNDHYGFALGDAVIRRLGQVLSEEAGNAFVGHIGGDDFICAGTGDEFRRRMEGARQKFRSIVPGFYSQRDREQGGIETFDRTGSYRFFPLLDVSLVFIRGDGSITTVEELAAAAGRRKRQLKGEQVYEPVHPVLRRAMGTGMPLEDKKALIEACGILREEDAVPLLDGILAGEYSWNLRKSAALALGHIGNRSCVEILLRSLGDSNPHVRTRSVEGLVLAMGSGSGPLIGKLASDRSTWVRRAVFRGMGRAGWQEGARILLKAALSTSRGNSLNTAEERRAALEGIAMLGSEKYAAFLHSLCLDDGYHPAGSAYAALCAIGTDLSAQEILKRAPELPPVVNLYMVGEEKARKLESLASGAIRAGGKQASNAVRFFEGFPGDLAAESISVLKGSLGDYNGELFRRVVVLLDSRNIPADRSCTARVASRINRGLNPGDEGLCAFLGWVSGKGGVNPGALLRSFIRAGARPVAASAALAAGALARRGLDALHLPVNNSVNHRKPEGSQ